MTQEQFDAFRTDLAKQFGNYRAGLLGTLDIVCRVLSAKALVLIIAAGGFWLTWVALGAPDYLKLAAVGVYGIFAAICVWLAGRAT